jgi:hypothetical protein
MKMAKFKVYHYDMDKYSCVFGNWYGAYNDKKCEAPKFGSYSIVAHVEADNIEKVFELTNSIHCYWGDNDNVDEVGKKNKRSTSVGDIIADENGKKYICESFGWGEYNG